MNGSSSTVHMHTERVVCALILRITTIALYTIVTMMATHYGIVFNAPFTISNYTQAECVLETAV